MKIPDIKFGALRPSFEFALTILELYCSIISAMSCFPFVPKYTLDNETALQWWNRVITAIFYATEPCPQGTTTRNRCFSLSTFLSASVSCTLSAYGVNFCGYQSLGSNPPFSPPTMNESKSFGLSVKSSTGFFSAAS